MDISVQQLSAVMNWNKLN